MGKQIFNIKGMTRDFSPSKTPNDFAYEIRNLRITAQEDSTMLSLVSEKGNSQYNITGDSIVGNIVGYCVLNQYLILFVHYTNIEPRSVQDEQVGSIGDRIYRLTVNGLTMESEILYDGNLGLGQEGVNIEAIGVYENQNIQKVYWIDGVHQPRFINISPNADTSNWYSSPTPFDFVPTMKANESVSIAKSSYNGMFNSGTIQYFLAYYNKNGQQSAIFYQSPINYIAPVGKGASPEDTVSNAFRIKITNPDDAFDFVRIYSAFRSSENGTPVCKKVSDLKISEASNEYNEYVKFTNVSLGSYTSVDYCSTPINLAYFDVFVLNTQYAVQDIEKFLEYREGSMSSYITKPSNIVFVVNKTNNDIIALLAGDGGSMNITIDGAIVRIAKRGAVKIKQYGNVSATKSSETVGIKSVEFIDNGLSGEVVSYSEILYSGGFNIIPSTMAQKSQTLFFGNYKTINIPKEDKETLKNHSTIHFGYDGNKIDTGHTGSFHMYENQLEGNAGEITTFKGGETYYFGLILQDNNGAWTEVIPLESKRNPYYPKNVISNGQGYFLPVRAYVTFDDTATSILGNYRAVKVVRLETLPSVVCQGVLCPTVFSKKRSTNSPYCQSSWFFRSLGVSANTAHYTQNKHNENIREGLIAGQSYNKFISEIQGASTNSIGYYDDTTDIDNLTDMDMFVDWNTLTLHSPDIEFGPKYNMNYKMRIVGILPITAGRTSMLYTWSTSPKQSLVGGNNVYEPIVHNHLDTLGYEIDLNVLAYKDIRTTTSGTESDLFFYPVYPWHRSTSLTGQKTPAEGGDWYALLDTKVMASLRESANTIYLEGPQYNITRMQVYQDDESLVMLDADESNVIYNGPKMYMGSVDTALVNNSGYTTYGVLEGQDEISTVQSQVKDPVRMRYKSTKHGIFSLKSYSDQGTNLISVLPNVPIHGNLQPSSEGYLSQITAKAVIKDKLSPSSVSTTTNGIIFNGIEDAERFIEGDVVFYAQGTFQGLYQIINAINENTLLVNYLDHVWLESHPGGDKVDYQTSSWSNNDGEWENEETYNIYFTYDDTDGKYYYYVNVSHKTGEEIAGQVVPEYYDVWNITGLTLAGVIDSDQGTHIDQNEFDVSDYDDYSYMYIAELYTNDLSVSYENNPWYVAGESAKAGSTCVEANIGDTYYQRYDCLKTYPYALEDQNQIVEIFSFMCETRVNIDGRYDNRRGMADNTSVLNTNFNLLNMAYTQDDNFFTYSYLDPDDFDINEFPNQIIWTKTKIYGSDVDAWTQIIPTSTLDMDGSLGEVRALKLWNDNLICFQDMGIAKIMYNERTTMSTEQGVPVEIANSGKVDGSHYISNSIGCSNKNSIGLTQEGIYFIDSNTREIYRWRQGLESLSKGKGFNVYMQNSNLDLESVKTFHDPKLKDVYFRMTKNSNTECLVFNEQLDVFTSFFDYDVDFMFPFKDSLIAVPHNGNTLWKQFANDEYLKYFGSNTYNEYKIQLVSAENPAIDKIFTGVEFRADVLNGKIVDVSQSTDSSISYASINKSPFMTMKVWNEYQNTGVVELEKVLRKNTNLSQKFRIWRASIERDTVDKVHKFNRIRSPWARIELSGGGENMKTVIHDIGVIYV